MISLTESCCKAFAKAIADYHKEDCVDLIIANPYAESEVAHTLYQKCMIDTIQWHLEDIIRDPEIEPKEALKIKKRIDISNQQRTDLVEQIDDYLYLKYASATVSPCVKLNTESPAWAIDRLSILFLKIYHMEEQVARQEVDEAHRSLCRSKLQILLEQRTDLITAIEELLADYASGKKRMKVYRQMKMYNDPSTNPILYNKEK